MDRLSFERLYRIRRQIINFVRRRYKYIALALLVIVAIQLIYPSSFAKPLVLSNGTYLGFKSDSTVADYYKAQTEKNLDLQLDNDKRSIRPIDVGISSDAGKAMNKASRDAVWQRLIPLSLLWPVSMQVSNWQVVDEKKLEEFAVKKSSEHFQAPKSAGAARNEKGEFILTPSEKGRGISKEDIVTALRSNNIERSQFIALGSHDIEPAVNNETVNTAIEKTKVANIQSINFEVADKNYKLSSETIQPWLTIEVDEGKKQASVGFENAAIEDWINRTIAVVNTGKPAIVTLRDGIEVSRTQGTAGRGVDKKKALNDLKTAITNKQTNVKADIVTLPIEKQTIRTYSVTNKGLNLLIEEWSREYPGMQAGVYLRELSGRGLSAEKNADNSMFAASVYKLWVAQFVLQKTDLNQQAYPGKTYGQCLDAMIRVSDNTCPHQIMEKHGYSTFNSYVTSQGFSRTNLSTNVTSPRDAGRFLERLYSGSLLDGSKTGQLLALLRAQIYRAGIPAGSPGATVADKPGFYGGSWHDAAIVQSPRSTYVLVVMTKGPGVVAVKTLAQRIHQTLN